ncbi:helix-turn-helix transcriptional regulator [Afifella sp. JA880]|uniref:helix-turn-helix domain-containing protein n=1 Tax=Afifella sp. JA880 TaxID=2975280 RepID=UPI0021BAAE70|nr:helix-turn-helix transcriptional regulator [Afifella sp. JA880]MCT8266153.1 helix-turn-helix transcriptional regulator [Afifella sp. JA880]
MTPDQFKAWRKKLGMKQKEAADRLGLKKRMIQYYETGERDGKKVKIPKSVRLACYALSVGIADYDGETTSYEDGQDPQEDLSPESEPSAIAGMS